MGRQITRFREILERGRPGDEEQEAASDGDRAAHGGEGMAV